MSRKIGSRPGTCDAANNNYHDENYHVGCYEDHGYGCYDDNDDEKGHDGLLGLMMS